MPSDGACLLIWWESTRRSLSFTLATIVRRVGALTGRLVESPLASGDALSFGKILKSRSALSAVAPARQGQISNAGAGLSRPVPMILIGMPSIRTLLLGPCSDISGRERAREVRLYGLCRCVRRGSVLTFLGMELKYGSFSMLLGGAIWGEGARRTLPTKDCRTQLLTSA
jgi:hypothetical protein